MNITKSDIGRKVVFRNGDIGIIKDFDDRGPDYYSVLVKIGTHSTIWCYSNGLRDRIPNEYDIGEFIKDDWQARALKAEKELEELKAKIQALL